MESSSPLNKVIEELIGARAIAKELLLLLPSTPVKSGRGCVVSAEDLVEKVLGSISSTIFILNSSYLAKASQVLTDTRADSTFSDGRNSERCKPLAIEDRKGCYKRRKTSVAWINETPNLVDDGQAWRKYGQKDIKISQHPKSYFRCTHKYDQGCQATKQVQMVQEDPPLYRTTYHGHHKCNNFLRTQQIILDSAVGDSSMISFESANPYPNLNNKQSGPNPFLSAAASILFPTIEQEERCNYKEELSSAFNENQLSSSDYFLSPDLTPFGPSTTGPMACASSSGSDHKDVVSTTGAYSCSAGTDHSIGMDSIAGPLDFDDFLLFEF